MTTGAERVGDLTLAFGDRRPARSRSGAPWTALDRGEGWALWSTPATPAWRGYDLTRADGPDGFTIALGRRPDHWLDLSWRAPSRQWSVRTDRFGTLQAYAGEGIVSTFSPATWDSDPDLDWLAIAGFCRLGWYPADRMPVVGVRLLRPASDHTWRADGASAGASRWQAWAHDPDRDRTLGEAARELGEVLAEILDAAAMDGRLALPISGGLDSRTTVAVLTRPGAPDADLWAYSYGYDEASPELRIAGEVAAARGLPLQRTVIGPHLLADLERVLGATEGLVDLTLCRQAAVAADLEDNADAVVAAHWGDVWFGMPAPPPGVGQGDALMTASTKLGHQWLTDHLVRPHLGDDPEEGLRDLMATEAERVAHIDDPRIGLTALKTEQWSLRWTEATLRAFQAAVPPRLPFYDPRLADFVLRLPSELLTDRRLQIEYLRSRAPDLARVEWQAKEADLFQLRHERTWRLPRRALRRLWRRGRPPRHRLRNWEVQLLEPEGRAGVDRLLLEPGSGLHALIDRAEVEHLVSDHRAHPGDPGLGYAVSALLTFAAWRQAFT
jgi:asparagine synthase (glutamine-hydrolysing)